MTDHETLPSWDPRIWRLPWDYDGDVPHALLDILRGCNLRCQACYNHTDPRIKPFDEVKAEVDELLRLRRLQSISIVGGEPLLQPELCDIVRFLRFRGLHVEIFTNGLLLDRAACVRLKEAGADLVFLHIDSGQDRPELAASAAWPDRRHLISEKAACVTAAGMEAGLAITAYPDRPWEVEDCVKLTLDLEDLGYLLVTRFREHAAIVGIEGDLAAGLKATVVGTPHASPKNMRSHLDMQHMLNERHAIRPFAGLGSNRDPHDARWLSYLVCTINRHGQRRMTQGLRASACERIFSALYRQFAGRYLFFVPWNATRFWLQLLLNAASGGSVMGNIRLAWSALLPGNRLHAKRLLFQNPAEVDASGIISHCFNCPDATFHHGKLVPVCLADLCRPLSIPCTSP